MECSSPEFWLTNASCQLRKTIIRFLNTFAARSSSQKPLFRGPLSTQEAGDQQEKIPPSAPRFFANFATSLRPHSKKKKQRAGIQSRHHTQRARSSKTFDKLYSTNYGHQTSRLLSTREMKEMDGRQKRERAELQTNKQKEKNHRTNPQNEARAAV